jgi:hypothetical protein
VGGAALLFFGEPQSTEVDAVEVEVEVEVSLELGQEVERLGSCRSRTVGRCTGQLVLREWWLRLACAQEQVGEVVLVQVSKGLVLARLVHLLLALSSYSSCSFMSEAFFVFW